MNRIVVALLYSLFGLLFAMFVIGPASSAAGLDFPFIRWDIVVVVVALTWLTADWLIRKKRWRIAATSAIGAVVTFALLNLITVEPLVMWLAVACVGAIPAAVCSWLSSSRGGVVM